MAVKRLRIPENGDGAAELEAGFRREIELHSSLSFPLIVPLLGVCLDSPHEMLMVMEQVSLTLPCGPRVDLLSVDRLL